MSETSLMIILILFVHLVADFMLQTDKMAKGKSTSNKWLGAHVGVYTLVMMVFGWKFALFNGAMHFVTDYFSSRIASNQWHKGEVHNFFVVVGIDQFIHAATLIISYELFLK